MNIYIYPLSIGIALTGLSIATPALANTPNIANYGAGFLPSPALTTNVTTPSIATGNYGAGFLPTPTLQGDTTGTTSTTYAAYYGAGFAGSPNMIYANSGIRYGHYGAGFYSSPRIFYGFNWFRW